jgi:hypothetical protein
MSEVVEDKAPFITVARMMNGYYFAAWMEWSDISGSFAVFRSGHVRSKQRVKALNEAMGWARRENVPFRA